MRPVQVDLACKEAMSGGLVDKIIGLRSGISGMVYSHCELYWRNDRESFVVSAEDGVAWKRRSYNRNWVFYPLPINEDEAMELRYICDTLLASKPVYDWPGLVHIGTLHLMGRQVPKWWFCSEQCAWAIRKLGYIDLLPLSPDHYTPSLLAYSVMLWNSMPDPVRSAFFSLARSRRWH